MSDVYGKLVDLNNKKGHDYAGDEDALANFKNHAAELGLTPEQIWGVYAGKHYDAIKTYVREGAVASEPIEGRIEDMILYLFLLYGLVVERREEDKLHEFGVDQHRDQVRDDSRVDVRADLGTL